MVRVAGDAKMNELVKRESGTIAVSEQARRYVRNSKSESTLRAYRTAWREFEHFAAERGDNVVRGS